MSIWGSFWLRLVPKQRKTEPGHPGWTTQQLLNNAVRTIQPDELASDRPYGEWSCRGRDIWDAFCAADKGDAAALRDVLARDPNLYRAEYWYTPPIHFAVRAGRVEATQVLLEAGADPAWRAMSGDHLATLARERGHETLARLLEHESRRQQGVPKPKQPADDPIVAAAKSGDFEAVRTRLAGEQDPTPDAKISRGLALHAAARAGNRPLVELLLDHGADPNFTIDSSGSATWAASTPELRRCSSLAAAASTATTSSSWTRTTRSCVA